MADSSLDDFFAKKDKSKRTKKFTTSDQIARKLEEGGKKPADSVIKKEKEKVVILPTSTSAAATTAPPPVFEQQADDEWRDFEEEKEKDYSGLKIQQLQLSETKEDEYDRERNLDDEDGEYFKSRDNMSGPWNKSSGPNNAGEERIVAERPESPPPPEPAIEENEEKEEAKPGVYRPPHARQSTGGTTTQAKARQSKLAPEISSELHFPSLSAAAADAPKGTKKGALDNERGFEAVKRGCRTSEEVPCRGPKLDLGNKYNTLSSGDMS